MNSLVQGSTRHSNEPAIIRQASSTTALGNVCSDAIRRSLSTTNTAQAVTGQLKRIRRNSGGYFQSDDALEMKLGVTITSLENGR